MLVKNEQLVVDSSKNSNIEIAQSALLSSTPSTIQTRRKRQHPANANQTAESIATQSLTDSAETNTQSGNARGNSKYSRFNSSPSITSTINITIPASTAAPNLYHSVSSASVSPVVSATAGSNNSLASPNSLATIPMTRSATAKLIKQTSVGGQLVVDSSKLLPPPQASLVPPKNLFNDDDDDEDDDENENECADYNETDYIMGDCSNINNMKRNSGASSNLNTTPSHHSEPTDLSGKHGVENVDLQLMLNDQSFSNSVGSSCSDSENKSSSIKYSPRVLLPPPPARDLAIPGTVKTLAQLRQRIAEARQMSLKRRSDQMMPTVTTSDNKSEPNDDEIKK
jgi:hypothetical protein